MMIVRTIKYPYPMPENEDALLEDAINTIATNENATLVGFSNVSHVWYGNTGPLRYVAIFKKNDD